MRVGDEQQRNEPVVGVVVPAGGQQALTLLPATDGVGRVVPAAGGASGPVRVGDVANGVAGVGDVPDVRSEASRVILRPDILYSLSLLVAVVGVTGGEDNLAISFRHDGPPKSKARPRVVNRHGRTMTFTPGESREAEMRLVATWKSALRGRTFDGTLAIACVFFRQNHQRIDADNMVKLVLDAGTKAKAWRDDSQLVTIVARIEYDKERPRTEVALMPTPSTLRRDSAETRVCERCGKDFKFHSRTSRSSGRFCSGACAQAMKLVIAACARCGVDFKRKRAGTKYCSKECSAAVTASTRRAAGRTPPVCELCGERVSRREYKRCAACRGLGRPKAAQLSLEEPKR